MWESDSTKIFGDNRNAKGFSTFPCFLAEGQIRAQERVVIAGVRKG